MLGRGHLRSPGSCLSAALSGIALPRSSRQAIGSARLRSPVVETSFDVRTYLLAHEWVILHCAGRSTVRACIATSSGTAHCLRFRARKGRQAAAYVDASLHHDAAEGADSGHRSIMSRAWDGSVEPAQLDGSRPRSAPGHQSGICTDQNLG
jgi:hypothetical protein